MLREEPSLSFRYLLSNSSSMVVRRVRLSSAEEQYLDACCSDVFASSGNVGDLGCDETLKGESWSSIGSQIRGKAVERTQPALFALAGRYVAGNW